MPYSIRMELDSIQSRVTETGSRLVYLMREARKRWPAALNYFEELPEHLRINLAIQSAGRMKNVPHDYYELQI